MKMPLVRSDISKERDNIEGLFDRFLRKFTFFTFDPATNERLKEPNYFTAPFVAAQRKCYVDSDNEDNRMVYDLLIRTRYDDDKENPQRIGINRLLDNGTYSDAYPIHEGFDMDAYDAKRCSNREMLYFKWARWTNFYKYQPLSLIKKYFGTKVGIYFAWLGYYTKCLIPAALIGCLFFLYGVFTFSNDIPSNDICGSDGVGAKIIMCPSCHRYCDFTQLNSSCTYAKISYMFDNYGTVAFAALMSILATLFLEGWKRYRCEFAWKWGLLDFEVDEETVRPEYQTKVKTWRKKRKNLITGAEEPVMPFKSRLFRFFGSGVAVLFCLLLVLAFVVGVIIYRLVVVQLLYRQDNMQNYASIVTFSTAAMLNLIVILMLNRVYTYIARKLTEWECPRTQADFDSSYTFKVFLFQVINYYSSIFYIAFIKGNISGVPGQTILGLQPEECDPAGCMVELVIQLAIIMIGKQIINTFLELLLPKITNYIRNWKLLSLIETKSQRQSRMKREREEKAVSNKRLERYERDFLLNPTYDQFLFDEYLEMVIQFGFVTLFVSAFPLAPLFALCNNILEIRLDAYKFTISSRKPVPERAKDIGMWLPILDGISRCAVLVNALIIAFTSDFIPKLVYLWVYNHNGLYGYVNSSLSYFDASSLEVKWSEFADQNVTECRFRDYRRRPCSLYPGVDCDDDYRRTEEGLVILSYRLGFVLIFLVMVSVIKGFISYIIPDVPSRIFVQLQRQRFLSRQARLSNINKSDSSVDGDRTEVAFQPGDFDSKDNNFDYSST
uniref:Anoctamin n=1 Tax=Syphacia muris TaxID=451379 RepID=A0A0N5A9A2_9BILA